jgi:hypothetical protein
VIGPPGPVGPVGLPGNDPLKDLEVKLRSLITSLEGNIKYKINISQNKIDNIIKNTERHFNEIIQRIGNTTISYNYTYSTSTSYTYTNVYSTSTSYTYTIKH